MTICQVFNTMQKPKRELGLTFLYTMNKNILREFLEYKAIYTSSRTQEIYHSNLQKFFKYHKYKPIEKYTMNDIFLFVNHLKVHIGCKGSTIANYIASIKSFFKYTKEMGYSHIPYALIKAPRYTENTPVALSEFEFDMIDEWLNENDFATLTKRVVFRLLWNTGARVSEVMNLNLSDIDTKNRCAIIKRQKNMQQNILMWDEETNEILIRYLGIRLCMDYKTDAVFLSPRNHTADGLIIRLNVRSVQRWIKQICTEIGIEKNITPHSFRHGKAHKILKKGKQEDVKAILGHKSIVSSDKYLRLNLDEQKELQMKYL